MTIKVQCACGQKFAFDVEPSAGQMPAPVACPACGTDATAQANDIIAQNLQVQSPAPNALRLNISRPPATHAPISAPPLPVTHQQHPSKWKWILFSLIWAVAFFLISGLL